MTEIKLLSIIKEAREHWRIEHSRIEIEEFICYDLAILTFLQFFVHTENKNRIYIRRFYQEKSRGAGNNVKERCF